MQVRFLHKIILLFFIFIGSYAFGQDGDRRNCNNLMKEKSFDDALNVCKSASVEGDAAAKLNLGTIYQHGLAGDKDINKAINLYGQSAKLGNSDAYAALALIYSDSQSRYHNDNLAFIYTLMAARGGVSHYQASVGKSYVEGTGVSSDLMMAYAWYSQALCGRAGGWYKSFRDEIENELSNEQLDLAKKISEEIVRTGLTKHCSRNN